DDAGAQNTGHACEFLTETLNDSSHKTLFNVPRLGSTKSGVINSPLIGYFRVCCEKIKIF
uniref:Uncharacterized protein n=1 Tax=Moschus moschiferus TaxID=68415 RepID=A0A8C6CJ13_MOSMO